MSQPNRKRILLGQLAANGDCLYATTVARQIKTDYPDCHLTWAIGSKFRSMIEGNPDVDEVWEIPYYTSPGDLEQWQRFQTEALQRKERGDFDEIFLTQISLDTFHLWAGPLRFSLFASYPRPITVDMAPTLCLSAEEVERARDFARKHCLSEKSAVILFECAPRSLQSFLTPEFALDVARAVVEKHPDVALILSSNHAFSSANENIIDGSVLSLRENAELTRDCSLLLGASSGVTWIATSDWAKPLPMVQLIRPDVARSNSPIADFQKRGADTSGIIEMSSYTLEDVVSCVEEILSGNFIQAKQKFSQETPLQFEHYKHVQYFLLLNRRWKQCFQFLHLNIKEYGFHRQFISLILVLVAKLSLQMPHKLASKWKGAASRF